MKNLYTGLLLFFLALNTTAQIGIGTTTPNATLEIKSSSQIAPANNDGILIPKIDAFPATNPTALQDGMMVFLTTQIGLNQPGFYYWNNVTSSWKGVGTHIGWTTAGNSGTNPTTNFIGTTDDNDVVFKRNNVQAGLLNSDLGNTSWGVNALPPATGGLYNTAIGMNALFSNISGYSNTANGSYTLYNNTTGNENTANGFISLFSNTTGSRNTANGNYALYYNTTGAGNVANGYWSLFNNTTGNFLTANGYAALYSNTFGLFNVANGYEALYYNTEGSYNTANGYHALYKNTTGYRNTANGFESLMSNTTGFENTANGVGALQANSTGNYNTANGHYALLGSIGNYNSANGHKALFSNSSGNENTANGANSLYSNTTGNENTGVGFYTDVASPNLTNATAIGARAYVGSSNSIVLGSVNGINGATSSVNVGIGTISPNAPLQFSNATVNRKIVLYDTNNNDNQYYGFGVNSGVFRYQTDATVADHAFFAGVNATTSNELMRIKGTGNVGIGTNNPTTKLEVNGFTKLGSNAPAIKVLKLTGTTANAQNGSVTILHGISPDKILSTTVLVEYSANSYIPASYGRAGFEFDFYISNNNIYIWNSAANSSSILSKPFKIMITYEE